MWGCVGGVLVCWCAGWCAVCCAGGEWLALSPLSCHGGSQEPVLVMVVVMVMMVVVVVVVVVVGGERPKGEQGRVSLSVGRRRKSDGPPPSEKRSGDREGCFLALSTFLFSLSSALVLFALYSFEVAVRWVVGLGVGRGRSGGYSGLVYSVLLTTQPHKILFLFFFSFFFSLVLLSSL
ncbi:hypothetical protein B0H34DRAFT_422832 [Crassisporium funariophilum]|nr:hypothetical protein B0H34DRAFT_422832 [Crassisporium funariophilum]